MLLALGCRDRDAPRPLPRAELGEVGLACSGPDRVDCVGVCVDSRSDPAHCGGCGKACKGGQGCVDGLCTEAVGWAVTAAALHGGVCGAGTRHAVRCPKPGVVGNLWGSDLYTDDSSVCTAAVHAGLLTLAAGGDVAFELRPGATSYRSTLRFGLTSQPWGTWGCSYVLLGAACAPGAQRCGSACTDVTRDTSHCGVCGHVCAMGESCRGGVCVVGTDVEWTSSVSHLPCTAGATHTFHCPATPLPTPQPTVWGSGPYTSDSSVCAAAVHAGKPTATVVVEIRPGLPSYAGTVSHGVTSAGWGAWTCSFVVR